MVIVTPNAIFFATAAISYLVLSALLIATRRSSTTRTILIIASLMTAASAAVVAIGWISPLSFSGSIAELAGRGGWCAFVLYCIGRQINRGAYLFRILCICTGLIAISTLAF